ncbi:MAG: hypothetical protein BA872_02845 [Desulfobacterales bacterium C00003060]|nr:MAG: hypothetical protein BA872_02845 [Desulfobacterales bacterium C00003060]
MNLYINRERLSQAKMLEWLRCDLPLNEMVTVYQFDGNSLYSHDIYCALIPNDQIERTLSNSSWDLSHGQGLPGAMVHHFGDDADATYLRFGNDGGIEPLVIDREFYGIHEDYKEISEEFRLFHSLYQDRKQDHYLKIDDDGNEHLVGIVEPTRVRVRLKEILQLLAIKEMHLSIQFDCREQSENTLEELGLVEGGSDQRDGLSCWSLCYGDLGGIGSHRAFSRLLGVRLIEPLPKSKSGFWGFADEPTKRYVDFIIGVNKNGDNVEYTSNPDALANYFGANPGAPHDLTAVSFRKEVLDKYYHQPGKYFISDGILKCGRLWSMELDNHHDDKVCTWLKDLGSSLSYEEQLHWRAHNISPDGGVSQTYLKRQILGQSTDSDRPEHLFRQRYHDLVKSCNEYLGWQLLLPLDADDEHHFQCVRISATDEQRDFDELVLGLTKILIDSLNEKQLKSLIPPDQYDDLTGSISRLEAALSARGVTDAGDHITFLRNLQNLRSASAAHRKGKKYRKITTEFGVDSHTLRTVFAEILLNALVLLDYLVGVVKSDQLSEAAPDSSEGTT